VRIHETFTSEKARKIYKNTSRALLKERIQFTRKNLHFLNKEITKLKSLLQEKMSDTHWKKCYDIVQKHYDNTFTYKNKKLKYKFEKLSNKPKENKNVQKTVINLPSVNIDDTTISVLEKGLNFAVAPSTIPTEEIISNIEETVSKLPNDTAELIRQETAAILRRSKPPKSNITKNERTALFQLKKIDNIQILKADKGNATVIMDKKEYKTKLENLLKTDTYKALKIDPTKTLVELARKTAKECGMDTMQLRNMIPQCPEIPRIYGVPKIHKTGVPLRPIVSTTNSVTYRLAKYLTNKLEENRKLPQSYVKDSAHLIQILKEQTLEDGDLLVSFDVESLFTNIPIEETLNLLKKNFKLDNAHSKLARLCLGSTYFTFDGKIYEQRNGAAMGSPLSPIAANIFMEYFEESFVMSSYLKPSLWIRYVDDCLVIWKHGKEELLKYLNYLNSCHKNIKFTIEIEKDKQIPFLDVLIMKRTDGTLGHTIYRKPTHTNKYLDAKSHHHPSQISGVVKTLTHRAEQICDKNNIKKEKENLVNIFKSNGYNQKQVRKLIFKSNKTKSETSTSENWPVVTLPYVKGTTEKIARLLKKHKIKTAHKPHKKIKDFTITAKDSIEAKNKCGVYKINCNCGLSYIGQTGRKIEERIKEHERNIRLKQTEKSAVAEHVITQGHEIEWEKTTLLHNNHRYKKRIITEAIEIHKHKNKNFNREDAYPLSKSWLTLIKPNNKKPIIINNINLKGMKTGSKSKVNVPTDKQVNNDLTRTRPYLHRTSKQLQV
jgi:hypothetical protein